MSKKEYVSAVEEIQVDSELIKNTAQLMKDSLSSKKGNRRPLIARYAAIAACGILIFALYMMSPLINNPSFEDLTLNNSMGKISVRYVENPSSRDVMSKIIPLTEVYVIKQSDAIIYGEVVGLQHIEVEVEEFSQYFTLVQIEITKTYKGNNESGEKITALVPCVVKGDAANKEFDILKQLSVGDNGFFILDQYAEDDYHQYPNARLSLKDISNYGFNDDKQFALIGKDQGYVYSKSTFTSLSQNPSYEEIERYIINILNQ